MASSISSRDEREPNPIGASAEQVPSHRDQPPRVSDAQLRAAAKVLDSYLHRAQEGAQHAGN